MVCINMMNLIKNNKYKQKYSLSLFNNHNILMSQTNVIYIVLVVLVGFTVSLNAFEFHNKHCNHQHPKADDVSFSLRKLY